MEKQLICLEVEISAATKFVILSKTYATGRVYVYAT